MEKIKRSNDLDSKGEGILYKEECFQIQGAVYDVYRGMGCGFLEAVYQECLEKEFESRGIPFEAQKMLPVFYKGEALKLQYMPDFICCGRIIVELKAMKGLGDEHRAQLLNYLKVTGMELGLLINFGAFPRVQIVRMANQRLKIRS